MTVKTLKEYLRDIPDDYEVIADDGRDGMESGSPIDGIVCMVDHKKICMAVGFEEEEMSVEEAMLYS